jgi:uncharacterized protein
MLNFKKTLVAILFAFTLISVSSAFAISLAQAKARGLVKEQGNGYVAASGGASADVKRLVNSTNSARRRYYQQIANSTGASTQSVASVAGKKLR